MKLSQCLATAAIGLAVLPFTVQAQACVPVPSATPPIVQLSREQIGTLFSDNRLLCGRPGSGFSGNAADRWQEEHLANGELWDYKRGDGHPVDPREKVGTWFAGGSRTTATITHAYGPTTAYAWRIFGPAVNNPGVSVYSFCNPASPVQQVRAFVITSATGCNGAFPP